MPPIMLLLFFPSLLGLWLAVKIVAGALRMSLAFVPLLLCVLGFLAAIDAYRHLPPVLETVKVIRP